MKFLKNKQIIFFAFCLLSADIVKAQDEYEDTFDFDFLEQLAENHDDSEKVTECVTQDAVSFLVDNLNIVSILKNPLYLRSNSPLNRSIHDLPTFTWTTVDSECTDLAILPFYNQTTKVFLSAHSPFIDSYLNLTGPSLLRSLDQFNLFFPANEILPLFGHITLQERRTGVYFRAGSNRGPWSFMLSAPLMYLERNFFLTQAQQDAISENEFIRDQSTGSHKDEVRQLLQEHLVADKIGMSDMRLHGIYTPYDNEKRRLSLGAFLTLPTAFAFKEGLIGGAFCKRGGVPALSLREIFCTFLVNGTVAERIDQRNKITQFGFGVLDKLTSIVGDTSLGNNGHVGIAPMVEYVSRLTPEWSINTYGTVQYLTPAPEIRSFLKSESPEEFDRNFTDPALAEENLLFLQNKLLDKLFPTPLKVNVHPGAIVQLNSRAIYTHEYFNASLGYDLYWQDQEHFKFHQKPEFDFEIHKAQNASIMQHKIFGALYGFMDLGKNTFQFGLRGDYTFASRGIGKDFTLAADIHYLY